MPLTVTSLADSGKGSLRDLIALANSSSLPATKIDVQVSGTIKLSSGPLSVTSSISITNESGGPVKILGQGTGIFNVTGGAFLELKRLHLTGGQSQTGGAIACTAGSGHTHRLKLSHCHLNHNTATDFGGAVFTQGQVVMRQCRLNKNVAGQQGGAVWAASHCTCYQTEIEKNKVTTVAASAGGGGIFIDDGDFILTDRSSLSHNEVAYQLSPSPIGGSGGGLVVQRGSTFVSASSKVNDNSSFNSAGIQQGLGNVYVFGNSSVSYNRSVNSANSPSEALAVAGGGGIIVVVGAVHVSGHSRVSHNKTQGMYSAGIVAILGDICISGESSVSDNENRGPGGGIAANFNSSVTIEGKSSVQRNTGASLGGAVVNFSLNLGSVTVSGDSSIKHNLLTDSQTIGETIAIFLVILSDFLDNVTAQASLPPFQTGGQALVAQMANLRQLGADTSARLQALTLPIGPNVGPGLIGGCGVATLLTCPVILIGGSEIEDNTFKTTRPAGTTTSVLGGGILALNSAVTLHSSRVFGNRATLGGGLFCGPGPLTCLESEIWSNKARGGGGGLFLQDSDATLVSSRVENNTSRDGNSGIQKTPTAELLLVHSDVQHQ